MQKIFVFKNQFTGENSAADLKELLTRYGIFQRPDVNYSQLTENFDGLKGEEITVVIPGGHTIFMGRSLAKEGKIPIIQALKRKGCNFINICAGAFLSTENAEIFKLSYELNAPGTTFTLPSYSASTVEYQCHLDIASDYTAVGPFYPTDAYLGQLGDNESTTHKNKLHPYVVSVSLNGEPLPQLYVEGCGFEPTSSNTLFKVEGTYHDRQAYTFSYPEKNTVKTLSHLPAILTKKADPTHQQGGVFLSGTHVETCVEDSHLLRFFHSPENQQKAHLLSDSNYERLRSSHRTTREKIVSLLKNTFKSVVQ